MGDLQHYPEVEALVDAVRQHRIRFRLLPRTEAMDRIFYRPIEVCIGSRTFTVAVEDEYDDVDRSNPALLLHLVLRQIEFYEEADDFLVWARYQGIDASDAVAREIHMSLGRAQAQVRGSLGESLRAIAPFEIELNSGPAQALRHAWIQPRVERIISGGQTGVDRAALDIALELGIPIGGYLPEGRRAEDGILPASYRGMAETDSSDPAVRTRRNIEESDGTLIICRAKGRGAGALGAGAEGVGIEGVGPQGDKPQGGKAQDGTALSIKLATGLLKAGRSLVVDPVTPSLDAAADAVRDWLLAHPEIRVLNVAGPRASEDAAIYALTAELLRRVFGRIGTRPSAPPHNDRLEELSTPVEATLTATVYIAAEYDRVWEHMTQAGRYAQWASAPCIAFGDRAGAEVVFGTNDRVVYRGQLLDLDKGRGFSHSFSFIGFGFVEPPGQLRAELRQEGPVVRVSILHHCPDAPRTAEMIGSRGWSKALCRLKTLLETGAAMPWPKD